MGNNEQKKLNIRKKEFFFIKKLRIFKSKKREKIRKKREFKKRKVCHLFSGLHQLFLMINLDIFTSHDKLFNCKKN